MTLFLVCVYIENNKVHSKILLTSLRLAHEEGFSAFGPSSALLRLFRNKRSQTLRARTCEDVLIRFKLMDLKKNVAQDTHRTNRDVVCKFQLNRFSIFRVINV